MSFFQGILDISKFYFPPPPRISFNTSPLRGFSFLKHSRHIQLKLINLVKSLIANISKTVSANRDKLYIFGIRRKRPFLKIKNIQRVLLKNNNFSS